jgi:hypothetical protein
VGFEPPITAREGARSTSEALKVDSSGGMSRPRCPNTYLPPVPTRRLAKGPWTLRPRGVMWIGDSDHQVLALWATSCAEHVLDRSSRLGLRTRDRVTRMSGSAPGCAAKSDVPGSHGGWPFNGRGQRPGWGCTRCRVRCGPGNGCRIRRRARARRHEVAAVSDARS